MGMSRKAGGIRGIMKTMTRDYERQEVAKETEDKKDVTEEEEGCTGG